jgi:hypothetical protein
MLRPCLRNCCHGMSTVVFPLLVLRLHPTQVFCITEMINSHMTVIPYRINLQWKTLTADKGKSVLRSEAAQNDFTILCLEMDI